MNRVYLFDDYGVAVAEGRIKEMRRELSFHGPIQIEITADIKFYNDMGCKPITVDYGRCGDYDEMETFKTIKDMDDVFFMNYMVGGHAPTHQFTNQADALAEAARLASTHKASVYTLKAIIKTKPKHDVITEELQDKALPEKAGDE